MKIVNEDTLEIEEIEVTEETLEESERHNQQLKAVFANLNTTPEEFAKKYEEYKKAESEFKKIYDPMKKDILEIYKKETDFPKGIVIGNTKLTYVSPSTRNSIDTKKLKEEKPEIVKEFTKTTSVDATLRIEEIISFKE